jgi:hypothetical protein
MPSDQGTERRRPPLPTLTEDDLREQGERVTQPPPEPMSQIVARLMGEGETPRTPPAKEGVELDALGAADEAEILAEIRSAYLARLGSRTHVPYARALLTAASRPDLDHWSALLLSLVDGKASIADVVDASSLPEVEALRLLCELRERGVIDVRPRR